MKHLTVDEIISFVSLTELNSEAINLAASVTGHIRKCEKCLNLVRAFQIIYDEFSGIKPGGDFKKYISCDFPKEKSKNAASIEITAALEELDGYK